MKRFILMAIFLGLVGCDSTSQDPGQPAFEGEIEQLNAAGPSLTVQAQTFWLDAAVQITDQRGDSVLFEDLQIGDFVAIDAMEDENGRLVASRIERDEETCIGSIGEETYENLNVPEGGSCTLDGTEVKGNLKVLSQATLAASGITVGGNLQAEGADSVLVSNQSMIEGNLQVIQGHAVELAESTVDGDLQLDENQGPVSASSLIIGGNMQITNNEGGVLLTDNQVASNLQCNQNDPLPLGSGNVAGSKEDQCANL